MIHLAIVMIRSHAGSSSVLLAAPAGHDIAMMRINDCNGTPMPSDGGEYQLVEGQWKCVECRTFVDGLNHGHLRSWGHLRRLTHQGIPTPWQWSQDMLVEKGWKELEPAEFIARHHRELMQAMHMQGQLHLVLPQPSQPPRHMQGIPGPPPGTGLDDDAGPPPHPRPKAAPPPPQGPKAAPPPPPGVLPAQCLVHVPLAGMQRAAGSAAAPVAAPEGQIEGMTKQIEKMTVQIEGMTEEIERLNSKVAAVVTGMERMTVQIEGMTVQIERKAVQIERLVAALASGGDITRRKAYVSSSNGGFLECTRPGPDSSSVLREHYRKSTRTAAKRAAADVVSWNTFGKHSENQASAG